MLSHRTVHAVTLVLPFLPSLAKIAGGNINQLPLKQLSRVAAANITCQSSHMEFDDLFTDNMNNKHMTSLQNAVAFQISHHRDIL